VPTAIQPPGGLVDQQRRPRVIRLAEKVDWYVVAAGRFERVGCGDVSEADLRAVGRQLGDTGLFACVARPPGLENYLRKADWGTKRIMRSARMTTPVAPKLRWVAKGSRLAVLPGRGTVWVDDEHIFKVGDTVPLPWTEPLVSLVVVRPAAVFAAMKVLVGPNGPKRALVPVTG
jgi:hypothetical protein